jgi:plasmid stabilization system protein ParE
MKLLRIRRLAKIEIDEAFDWYEIQRPGLGIEFLDDLNACLKRIQLNPLLYQKAHRSTHRALLDQFPYALLYRVTRSTIILLGCRHERQDPNDWMQRT